MSVFVAISGRTYLFGLKTLVDDEVAQKIAAIGAGLHVKVTPGGAIYVRISFDYKTQTMLHRWIMGAEKGQIIDHINGNPLDNRKENLRFCSHKQNSRNQKAFGRSKYKGVSKIAGEGKGWRVAVKHDGGRYAVGSIPTEEEAAEIHDALAAHFHGEHARLNFPDRIPMTFEHVEKEYPKRARVVNGQRVAKSSKFKGVSRQRDKWCAQVWLDGRVKHVGLFESEIEAALAYDKYARAVLGDGAKTNFNP